MALRSVPLTTAVRIRPRADGFIRLVRRGMGRPSGSPLQMYPSFRSAVVISHCTERIAAAGTADPTVPGLRDSLCKLSGFDLVWANRRGCQDSMPKPEGSANLWELPRPQPRFERW